MARAPVVGALTCPSMAADSSTQKWICVTCGWIYDPVTGDIDGGIPPGTPFEEIPGDWFCPVCGARTKDFELLAE